jgi:hypothetical protein
MRSSREIVIQGQAHAQIRERLERYGLFEKQLFPDLDGVAKWLRYRSFEVQEEQSRPVAS